MDNRNGKIIGYDLRYNNTRPTPSTQQPSAPTVSNAQPIFVTVSYPHNGVSVETQTAKIEYLDKFTQYCFEIRAKTRVGSGPYTESICARTREDGNSLTFEIFILTNLSCSYFWHSYIQARIGFVVHINTALSILQYDFSSASVIFQYLIRLCFVPL